MPAPGYQMVRPLANAEGIVAPRVCQLTAASQIRSYLTCRNDYSDKLNLVRSLILSRNCLID